MKQKGGASRWHRSERGATLYIVAGSMVVLLGISALAIDLVNFYMARAEAQKAADAGALAGASQFISSGCTSTGGCVAGGPQEAPAKTQATAVASQNPVAGQAPSASNIAVGFNYPNDEEPQIEVTVYRDAAHGNPLPTYFGKIFGINTVNVSATAWAEAYNPSGSGGVSVGVECIRPFLVPNCDPNHLAPTSTSPEANPNCPCAGDGLSNCTGAQSGYYMQNYFDPTTGAIVNPGDCLWSGGTAGACTGPGVIGAYWQLHDNAAPSQWYTIAFTGQSGAQYRQNIYTCAPQAIACNTSLNTLNGKKVGPTDQGIQTLIHASGDGLGQGQDVMCEATAPFCDGTPPFTITGGANNPYGLAGDNFTNPTSDSISNVVVYDGAPLTPGGSTVTVVGYMQLFIQDVQHNGPSDMIEAVVMNLGGCGNTSSSSNPPPVTSEGGSFIPIRLIHQ